MNAACGPARPPLDGRAPASPRRGMGDLVRELVGDTRALFRQEVRLARAELTEKACEVGQQSVLVLIGGGLALAGAIALTGALCAGVWSLLVRGGMSNGLAVWLAPLIVGAVIVVAGYALIQTGISKVRSMRATPDRTARSLKETAQWMQNKVA